MILDVQSLSVYHLSTLWYHDMTMTPPNSDPPIFSDLKIQIFLSFSLIFKGTFAKLIRLGLPDLASGYSSQYIYFGHLFILTPIAA